MTEIDYLIGEFNRHCGYCQDDVRLMDDPTLCEHESVEYCSPKHMRAGCGECHSDRMEDL